jgi:hypothetical protein
MPSSYQLALPVQLLRFEAGLSWAVLSLMQQARWFNHFN